MSLFLFKVLFSLFTAKLPLNHHVGNMFVFFLSTERANLSDVCGDVLGLERDGTNGLDQSLVSKTIGYSIWVEIRGTGVGVC